jgi:hypothetical protein
MRFIGTVVADLFGAGTNSEHRGVFLRSEDGQRHLLRRRGGHAFQDETLEGLVGKRVEVEGEVVDYLLLVDRFSEIAPG